MKKILFAFLTLIAFCAKAQNDSSRIEMDSVDVVFVKLPASTAVGVPDGKLVSKEIGPSGGRIISDDQRVELIFPAGALKVNTAISIQPIEDLIPHGNGNAYQFEPSGIQFQKPVQVIFHYTDAEAAICPPELKFMAVQDHNGKWEYMNYDDWDSTGKSLKGFISHFSAVLNGNLVELSPSEKTLKVGERFLLNLDLVAPPEGDELPPLPVAGQHTIWFVNGGGTVTRSATYSAVYSAPRYLNRKNAQVVMKVNETTIYEVVQRTRHGKGIWRGTTWIPVTKNLVTFTCDIHFYDEYKLQLCTQGRPF